MLARIHTFQSLLKLADHLDTFWTLILTYYDLGRTNANLRSYLGWIIDELGCVIGWNSYSFPPEPCFTSFAGVSTACVPVICF